MTDSQVRYELSERVAILRLNDPATLNSMSTSMVEALTAGFDRALGEARAIVITGEGRGFCSGANLSSGTASKSRELRDMGAGLESHFNPLLMRIRSLPMPVLTAVNGPAVGIGCSLALMGDLIVAAQSAVFIQAFSKVALVPDGGSPYLLAAAIGRVRAMEMMLLGDKVGANQALEWGLVNRVVPDEKLLEATMALAARIAHGATRSLGVTRQLAWQALETPFEKMLHLERQQQCLAGREPEFDEGVAAFKERRAPDFLKKS